jgi:serine/threonine protein kinase
MSSDNKYTRKNSKIQSKNKNTTKKTSILHISSLKMRKSVQKLNKCSRSRITGMETYRINCGKNLIVGYQSIKSSVIKSSEETSIHKDDFVHVVLSELQDYDKPVIVKVYDTNNFHLHIEIQILKKINGFRNSARLICEFACEDDKNKYVTRIRKQIRFCNNGSDKLHFFVYEYIVHGDISDFLTKNQDIQRIKSLILQITCVFIQLASIYKIYHGDINTGNILIDSIDDKTIDYCIDDETFTIESHGIIPKIIDYGRSNFFQGNISNNEVWFEVILSFGVIYHYIQNDVLKKRILDIAKNTEMNLPTLKDYYIYVLDSITYLDRDIS